MRLLLPFLVLVAAIGPASAQLPTYARPLIVELSSGDSTRSVTVGIRRTGAFLARVGVPGAEPGHVVLTGDEGSVTTPALMEFAEEPGEVVLRARYDGPPFVLFVRAADGSGTQTLARGYDIRVQRDAEGRVRIGAAPQRP